MRKFCFLIPLLILFSPAWMAAQLPDTLVIRFSQELCVQDSGSYGLPEAIRHVGADSRIHIDQFTLPRFLLVKITGNSRWMFSRHTVVVPEALKGDTALGYTSMYYTGNNHRTKTENELVFLVQHPRDTAPIFYADRNGNLDFTDDGPPVQARDSIADVVLEPSAPGGMALRRRWVCRHPGSIAFRLEEDSIRRAESLAAGKKIREIRSPDRSFGIEHALSDDRLNTRYADTTVAGIRLRCSLTDETEDGLFTAIKSKKEYFGDVFRTPAASGNWMQEEGAYCTDPIIGKVIRLGNRNYSLAAVAPNGDWIRLTATHQPLTGMVEGGKVPDFEAVPLAGGKAVSWASVKDTTRYTLIDVWGTWCKGCVEAAGELHHLDSLYRKQVQLVGIAQDKPERAQEFLARKGATWSQFLATDEIIKLLEVEGFPSYILLDPKGQIVKLRTSPADVEAFLQELAGKTTGK